MGSMRARVIIHQNETFWIYGASKGENMRFQYIPYIAIRIQVPMDNHQIGPPSEANSTPNKDSTSTKRFRSVNQVVRISIFGATSPNTYSSVGTTAAKLGFVGKETVLPVGPIPTSMDTSPCQAVYLVLSGQMGPGGSNSRSQSYSTQAPFDG